MATTSLSAPSVRGADPRLMDAINPRRNRIAAAALVVFEREGICEATYASIVAESKVARSSAHRELPTKSSILGYLHKVTVAAVDATIARRVGNRGDLTFLDAARAGARGVFEALSWSAWTSDYLMNHPDQATSYLCNTGRGSLIDRLACYLDDAASRAGRKLDRDVAVWYLAVMLRTACDGLDPLKPRWPSDDPEWPEWVDELCAKFVDDAGLKNTRLDGTPTLNTESGDDVQAAAVVLASVGVSS